MPLRITPCRWSGVQRRTLLATQGLLAADGTGRAAHVAPRADRRCPLSQVERRHTTKRSVPRSTRHHPRRVMTPRRARNDR